jgi:hypothetical protein
MGDEDDGKYYRMDKATLTAALPRQMPQVDISKGGATNMSFHLKELDRANVLSATRQGRYVRYAVHVEGMRKLLTYLTEDCCQSRPELCGEAFAAAGNVCRVTK